MFVYILNYLLLLHGVFYRNRTWAVLFLGLQLFLVLAFRSDCLGVDWPNYQWEYANFSSHSLGKIIGSLRFFSYATIPLGKESGYVLFNWLLGNLGLSYHSFLVVHSLICVVSLCFFIHRYSKIPWLSFAIVIALGMYGYMFCILRQSLAVAVLYFAFPFIKDRQLFKFLGVIVLASMFHFIAFVFFPVYWIAELKISYQNIARGLLCVVIIMLSTPILQRYVFRNLFFTLGKSYTTSLSFTYNNMLIFMFFIVVFVAVFYWDFLKSDGMSKILFWSLFMALPVQMLGFFTPIFSRASIGVFLPIASILIPNLIHDNKDENSAPFFSLLFFLLFFLYYIAVFESSGLNLNPYVFHEFD